MPSELLDAWPYFRESPDLVTLTPRPGTTPSSKPPVRIFLGTEEAQYRAERIFFWSIEKFRDPSRTYEIYLMKNIAGFDRKGWRTGFTKYRFAIPDFAGRQGRAIYNDVDQIYLADPALLFDLDMGSHGYLAISPEETSVMLIDCERMWPIWNRETANKEGKHALIKKPAKEPGLWGPCDPHWNARDLEYVEGRTKCLHYTLLHQQPWQPFPNDYSYHPNPLAYIWYDLEQEADRARYQVFTRQTPTPGYWSVLNRNEPPSPQARGRAPAGSALAMARTLDCSNALVVSALGDSLDAASFGLGSTSHHKLSAGASWPEEQHDAVAATAVFEIVPAGDIAWIMDALFGHARKFVYVQLSAMAKEGLGSGEWWRRRLSEAADRHPGVSWHLDVLGENGAAQSFQARRMLEPGAPMVWALVGEGEAQDAQVLGLAEALGWPFESKRLAFSGRGLRPNMLIGASLNTIDRGGSSPLHEPWPDLVIAAGQRSVPVARWIKQQSRRTRLVQLGRPAAPFDLFDLVVAQPDQRLPIRDNVLQVSAPLAGLRTEALEEASTAWRERLADLPRPWTALIVGSRFPYVLTSARAAELGRLVKAQMTGGAVLVAAAGGTHRAALEALTRALDCPHRVVEDVGGEDLDARAALLSLADSLVVTSDDVATMAAACLTGKPVALFELPKWYYLLVVVRPVLGALGFLTGGGLSYRGTPHQQHVVGRLLDEATARGLISLPRDPGALQKALLARGLVTRLGEEPATSPKPLDDLALTVQRIRRLMTEVPESGTLA